MQTLHGAYFFMIYCIVNKLLNIKGALSTHSPVKFILIVTIHLIAHYICLHGKYG
jgi:hypothetical protein